MGHHKSVVNHTVGEGLKICKFHYFRHLTPDIEEKGVPLCCTGHVWESNQKFTMKVTALHTQKQAQSIDCQCRVGNYERVAITRGKLEIDLHFQDKDSVDGSARNPSFFHQKTVGSTKEFSERKWKKLHG